MTINKNPLVDPGQSLATQSHHEPPPVDLGLDGLRQYTLDFVAEAALLVAAASLLVIRRNIKKQLRAISQILNPTEKLAIDLGQDHKIRLTILLEDILQELGANNVALGILYNGQISEWGYSFSKVTFELEAHSPRFAPISRELNKFPINTWLPKANPGYPGQPEDTKENPCQPRWQYTEDYWWFPVVMGNVTVAVLVANCYDHQCNQRLSENLKGIQGEMELIKSTLISFVTKSNPKST
jgi:hypothetical protein